jgi:hypothetical protein
LISSPRGAKSARVCSNHAQSVIIARGASLARTLDSCALAVRTFAPLLRSVRALPELGSSEQLYVRVSVCRRTVARTNHPWGKAGVRCRRTSAIYQTYVRRVVAEDDVQRLATIARFDDGVTLFFERRANLYARILVIFRDENPSAPRMFSWFGQVYALANSYTDW